MNNFKYFFLAISVLLISLNFNAKAQEIENAKKAHLESQKVSFITNKLNLTVDEAQKFWPVYNEYQQKKQSILKDRKQLFISLKNKNAQLSDEELTKISDQYIQLEVEESKLSTEYHTKFKQVLPILKVVQYYRAEEQFKVWLLKEVKEKQKQQINQGKNE